MKIHSPLGESNTMHCPVARADIKIRWAMHNAEEILWGCSVGPVVLAIIVVDQRRYVVSGAALHKHCEGYS